MALGAWRRRAACRRGEHWELFLRTFEAPANDPDVKRAKAICATCPVRRTCLREHLDEQNGVWGGMTGRERRRLKRKLAAQPDTQRIVGEDLTRGDRCA
jgi:WhiB family redox-sensing transcriptional regulator